MLTGHTDIIVARNSVVQAERTISRERARVIPDVQNQFYFEQDTLAKFQGAPNFQMGAQIGITVPLFNRNQGAILSAQALLARAHAEIPRVRNQLTLALTDAFNRYETARLQIVLYREKILPNLVTAFRGVYNRYQVEPDKVNYNDIVTAQQNLVTQLAGYLQALQQQWQAYTDLAGALQFTQPGSILPAPSVPGPKENGPAVPPVPDSWPEPAPRATVPKKKG
jgi:cobalt-zinc-cadmium efflux system outer membrane protein